MILRRYHFVLLLLMASTGVVIWYGWCVSIPILHYLVVSTHIVTGVGLTVDAIELFVKAERRGS